MSSLRLLLLAAFSAGSASGSSFAAQEVSKAEASDSLLGELNWLGSKDQRWQSLTSALSTTYTALPKNKHGLIEHQAARYALHRFFVQQYGWYIKGLEPNIEHASVKAEEGNTEAVKAKEWLPTFLQSLLEDKLGHDGIDLDGLVALAASLEDLVAHETEHRLKTAYEIHALPMDKAVTREQANDLVRTWYVAFLLAGNFSASSPEEVHAKKANFARRYSDWTHAEEWLKTLEDQHYYAASSNPSSVEYRSILALVSKIGEQYFHFNDGECHALKSILSKMEGKKAGRVRLSTFYQKSLYSHWRFTEKADYLRRLGALDESDAKAQHVLVTNYVMARPNCLESSGLYAICCRNECEDLMAHLEDQLKKSEAEPSEIATLVANLASDTVTVPRVLDSALLARLDQVAAANAGKVPLHGRLFAQWMHHAYPRECPYPHQFGTTSPMTPDEWMQATGQTDSSASHEEMQQHVESDVCKLDAEGRPMPGCDDEADLPWSEAEELLAHAIPNSSFGATSSSARKGSFLPAALAITLALALAYEYWRALRWSECSKGDVFYVNAMSSRDVSKRLDQCKKALAVWAVAVLAWLLDLLDGPVFAASMTAGLALVVARGLAERRSMKVL
eukprot:TRINITY_DN21711_c0_g2_i1.p1 TRINITY_DN21711_c0_g2~~TRINITY_DN21711_c0_g2_i1.p1  ORF type:complete len:620 (-),score=129.24 TRINITY_DN21711_c0_g2_i1:184-2043(-)